MRASDDDRRPVSERVVDAVGGERDADPTDLSPLYDAVDPEALDALFSTAQGEPTTAGDSARQFTFTYEGFVVDVTADGAVELSPADSGLSHEESATTTAPAAATRPESPD
jgi:hypothetical protein